MCRYAQNSRSGSGSGSSGNKSWRVCETFAPHVPEEFLKRLASTNTTATAVGNRGAINATADYIQLSRRSVSVLRIPGTACRILEACLTAIASVVLLVRWGWRYSHHWLGGFTDRKGGGWMLNRRENRTQEREDCTTCVAIDDFADGCITPHGDRRQNSTSKAFYRKSVRLGTRSCGGGLRHVLLFAVIAGIGPAAEGDGHGQSVLTVPLTPAGFQYTVGVTVSGENYDYNAVRLHWRYAGGTGGVDGREVGSARGFVTQVFIRWSYFLWGFCSVSPPTLLLLFICLRVGIRNLRTKRLDEGYSYT